MSYIYLGLGALCFGLAAGFIVGYIIGVKDMGWFGED